MNTNQLLDAFLIALRNAGQGGHPTVDQLRELVEKAAQNERERCATLAERHKCGPNPQDPCGPVIAEEIRKNR